MQEPVATLTDLFTTQFGPRRAEAIASEITRMAARLGAVKFTDTLRAIGDRHPLANPGLEEKTLALIVERMMDDNGNRHADSGLDFARRMNEVLCAVSSDDLHSMLETVCCRLRAAAYPPTPAGLSAVP